MKKKVNIIPRNPIYALRPAIVGTCYNVEMNTGDIAVCLSNGARVQEILSNGIKLELNFSNYKTINEPVAEIKKEEKKVEFKIPENKFVSEPSIPVGEPPVEDDAKPAVNEEPKVEIEEPVIEDINEEPAVKEEVNEAEEVVIEEEVDETTEEAVVEETPVHQQPKNNIKKNRNRHR